MLKSYMFPIANRLLLQPIGRVTRGMTLGTRAVVRDADGRMLVVRQRYTNGWIFPGGGVDRGEAPVTALKREVIEETGVRLTGDVCDARIVFKPCQLSRRLCGCLHRDKF